MRSFFFFPKRRFFLLRKTGASLKSVVSGYLMNLSKPGRIFTLVVKIARRYKKWALEDLNLYGYPYDPKSYASAIPPSALFYMSQNFFHNEKSFDFHRSPVCHILRRSGLSFTNKPSLKIFISGGFSIYEKPRPRRLERPTDRLEGGCSIH